MKSSPQLHVGGHCCSMRQGRGGGEVLGNRSGDGADRDSAEKRPKKRDLQCQAWQQRLHPGKSEKKKKKKRQT